MFRFLGKLFRKANNQENNATPNVMENANPMEADSSNVLPPVIGIYRPSSVILPQESRVQQGDPDDGPVEGERPDTRQSTAATVPPKRKRKQPIIPEFTPKRRRQCSPDRARTVKMGNVSNPTHHTHRNRNQDRTVGVDPCQWRTNYYHQLGDVNFVRPQRQTACGRSNYSQFGRVDDAMGFNNWERVRRLRKTKNHFYHLVRASLEKQNQTQIIADKNCSPVSRNFGNDIKKAASKFNKDPEVRVKSSLSLKNHWTKQKDGKTFSNPKAAKSSNIQSRCILPKMDEDQGNKPKTETFSKSQSEEENFGM